MANSAGGKPPLTGIIVALPEELATLSRRRAVQGECFTLTKNTVLAYAGAGPENAERAARLLLEQGANRLLSWGCAAALTPQLKPGDLLIPEQVFSAESETFDMDVPWLEHTRQRLPSTLSICSDAVAESRGIVADSKEKKRLHDKTGAAGVDMESAGICRVAAKAGVPAMVIRAIADPAGMALPQAVVKALNSKGQVEISVLLLFLLTHPWELSALIRLGLYFQAARKTLQAVAGQLTDIVDFQQRTAL